jgi:PKD repeat protein
MKFKTNLKRKDYDSVTLFFTLLILIALILTSCTSNKSSPSTAIPPGNTISPVNSSLPPPSPNTGVTVRPVNPAGNWGPINTSKGNIETFYVNKEVGIGSISYDIGKSTESTYFYAIDIASGKLIGESKIAGRCSAIEVGEKYVFVWIKDGINVYDLQNKMANVRTLPGRGVNNLGSYFLVEDRAAADYLVDKTTLQKIDLNTALGANKVTDDSVFELLYPDCLIGDPEAFKSDQRSQPAVYSLKDKRFIGRIPSLYLSGIFAWDSKNKLVFCRDQDKIQIYDLSKDKIVSELSFTNSEAYSIDADTKNALPYYLGTGNRLNVVRDFPVSSGGYYFLNGKENAYLLNSSGGMAGKIEGSRVIGEYQNKIFYEKAKSLGANKDSRTNQWLKVKPDEPITGKGPYFTESSIAWLCDVSTYNDVIYQWKYDDGSFLNYTEFSGYDVKVLASNPLILAMRSDSGGLDAQWQIYCYHPSSLPFNVVPEISIVYSPKSPYAGDSVSFSSSVKNLPSDVTIRDINWEWDFGDGTKGTGGKADHIYKNSGTYAVKLTARLGNSVDTAKANLPITVQEAADVYLKATPSSYTRDGLSFIFECKSQGSVKVSQVEWDFGGGKKATGMSATQTFTPGQYTVKARIYNSQKTQSWDKEITIISRYPDYTVAASPSSGPSPLKVKFSPVLKSGDLPEYGLKFRWAAAGDTSVEGKTCEKIFVEPRAYTVTLNVVDPAGRSINQTSIDIQVNQPAITLSDGGCKLSSDGLIFVDRTLDRDKDGINQPWEDAAMNAVNPYFELDEGEEWLNNRGIHNVANIVRVMPYPENVTNPDYILFIYVVAWSRDYGRYGLEGYYEGFKAHNGDREKVIEAWKVVDNRNLELKWVYTSAHGTEACSHSAVWAARGSTTNPGQIAYTNIVEYMTASLEFQDNRLKLYASEDKHSLYPTKECGEAAILFPPNFGEDCGDGERWDFVCYNAGEPSAHLKDDMSEIFPNEWIWSGNKYHPDKFCGGLDYSEECPGTLGGYLQPETILKEKLKD